MEINNPEWFKNEKSKEEFNRLPEEKFLFKDDLRYDELALNEMANGSFLDDDGKRIDGVFSQEFYNTNIVARFERLFRVLDSEQESIAKRYKDANGALSQTEFDFLKSKEGELIEKRDYLTRLQKKVEDKYNAFVASFSDDTEPVAVSLDSISLN